MGRPSKNEVEKLLTIGIGKSKTKAHNALDKLKKLAKCKQTRNEAIGAIRQMALKGLICDYAGYALEDLAVKDDIYRPGASIAVGHAVTR
ncbi:MAG: hypothetical protein GY854_26295 [Deltaproteobacteria bacterium]|nr:hypothetical protein [Deltaproteobacteria bacterium]